MAIRATTVTKYVETLKFMKSSIEFGSKVSLSAICKQAGISHAATKAIKELGIVEKIENGYKWTGGDVTIDMATQVAKQCNSSIKGDEAPTEEPKPFSGGEFRDLMEENNKLLRRNNDLLFSIFSIMQIKVKDGEAKPEEPANGELNLQ